MHLRAGTLDDLLDQAFKALLGSRVRLKATKGRNAEVSGVVLELTRPRARLSRTEAKGHIFTCLGELLWYISASNKLDQIRYYFPRYNDYAEADGTIWGAYGPRIFGGERTQYEAVRDLLIQKPTSRQAVIQLFDRSDIEEPHADVPCTCTIQMLVRDGRLNMVVSMRSNDAFLGFPHDVFSFTMLQELMACDLGYRLGSYKHMVGSFHLYDEHRALAEAFLEEGVQSTREMPEMPTGRQWEALTVVLTLEQILRKEGIKAIDRVLTEAASLDAYWQDLVRLLAIYALTKGYSREQGDGSRLRAVVAISGQMTSPFYRTYVRRRARPLEALAEDQPDLIDKIGGGT